jgi:hypothetical protein
VATSTFTGLGVLLGVGSNSAADGKANACCAGSDGNVEMTGGANGFGVSVGSDVGTIVVIVLDAAVSDWQAIRVMPISDKSAIVNNR